MDSLETKYVTKLYRNMYFWFLSQFAKEATLVWTSWKKTLGNWAEIFWGWYLGKVKLLTEFIFEKSHTRLSTHAHTEKGMFLRYINDYNSWTIKDFKNRLSPFNFARKGDHFCFFYDFRKMNFGRFSILLPDFFSQKWP